MTVLIIIHCCFLLFFFYVQHFFEKDKPLYAWFYNALVLKVLSGVVMGALYVFYYESGDIKGTYDLISRFSTLFYANLEKFKDIYIYNEVFGKGELYMEDSSTDPRLWFFVKLLVPIGILIDNYWLLNIYVSVFSFMGLWNLSNRIVSVFPVSKTAVVIAFLLFPSVVFWSSGMLKEAVLMGSIGFCMSFYLKWVYQSRRPEFIELLVFVLGLWIIWNIKYYVFSILFFLMVTHFTHRMLVSIFPWLKAYRIQRIVVYYVVLGLMGMSAGWIHPNLSILNLYDALHQNYHDTIVLSNDKNVFHLYHFDKGPWGFLIDFPKALLCGLWGPVINKGNGWIGWLYVLENYMLILLTGYFIVDQFRRKWEGWTLEHMIVLNYIVLMASFLAFASPNWGSLARYKVSFMPLFILFILSELPAIRKLDIILFPERVKEIEKTDTPSTTD